MPPAPPRACPLSTLLSQVLVAYTIEFDNQAELRLPHHTDRPRPPTRPTPTDDTARHAGPTRPGWCPTSAGPTCSSTSDPTASPWPRCASGPAPPDLLLEGLRRWRYLRLLPAEGQALHETDPRRHAGAHHPPRPPGPGDLARPARRHGRALARPLRRRRRGAPPPARWPPCSPGCPSILPPSSPSCTPRRTGGPRPRRRDRRAIRCPTGTTDLVTLLAGVLLSFTLDFEAESRLSLAIGANTLRVLDRRTDSACATCPA